MSQLRRALGEAGTRTGGSGSAKAGADSKSVDSGQLSRGFGRLRGHSSDAEATAGTLSRMRNRVPQSAAGSERSADGLANGRPTTDQLRSFLRSRDGGNQVTSGSLERRGRGSFNRDSSNRNDNTLKTIDLATGNIQQKDLRSRVNESRAEGDRAWARRFGKLAGAERGQLERRDVGRRGDGGAGKSLGDARRPGIDHDKKSEKRGPIAHDGRSEHFKDRDFGHRKFGFRDFADGKYREWKKTAWHGKGRGGHDHRDASGRWRDGDRFFAAHKIRDHWRGHKHFKDIPFHGGWWKHRHFGHRHWRHWDHFAHVHHRPFYWWSWCPAPVLTTWFTFSWPAPWYWDYGPGEYIYCYDDVIYVNGQWFQPAPVYYERTLVLAQQAPELTPEEALAVEWLPLGVFAVARDGIADHNVLVQLAVTKDGVIGGTVFNQATGTTFTIEGTVDQNTQRAVWTYVDDANTRVVMETSVFNLTQPEATGLIHYGPDDIQVVELVRLEEPTVSPDAVPAS